MSGPGAAAGLKCTRLNSSLARSGSTVPFAAVPLAPVLTWGPARASALARRPPVLLPPDRRLRSMRFMALAAR
eukprot:8427812-Lingulodinium_polyedra.AAC.1